MFTKEQAVSLLEKSWGMTNVEKQLETDPKKLLNNIIVIIEEKVPFNVLFVRLGILEPMPFDQNLDYLKEFCISGNGGNCMLVNSFTCYLLNGLGYSANVSFSTVTSHQVNPHLIIIVKDLEKVGDLHLVDCGLGQPSFQVISLNFDQESPIYRDSFLEYKFIRHGECIFRMHRKGDVVDHSNKQAHLDFYVGDWRRYYSFNASETYKCSSLTGNSFFPVDAAIRNTVVPRVVRFPGGKAVLIIGNKLFLERSHDQTLEKITMGSFNEILKAYRKYFPTVDENIVYEANATWIKQYSKL